MAHPDALYFFPVYRQAGDGGAVTIGIASHDPAYGFAANATVLKMGLSFPGPAPHVVRLEFSLFDVHLHGFDGMIAHEPFQLS